MARMFAVTRDVRYFIRPQDAAIGAAIVQSGRV
jgi:hypothetical protein